MSRMRRPLPSKLKLGRNKPSPEREEDYPGVFPTVEPIIIEFKEDCLEHLIKSKRMIGDRYELIEVENILERYSEFDRDDGNILGQNENAILLNRDGKMM